MKNKTIPEKTIIQEMYPLIEAFPAELKNLKTQRHVTAQDIADNTGVPKPNIDKLFAGTLVNPNVYNMAAVCRYLGASVDRLLGVVDVSKIDKVELREENMHLKSELNHKDELLRVKEEQIAQFKQSIRTFARSRNFLIGTVVFLVLVAIYLAIDASFPAWGLFRNRM